MVLLALPDAREDAERRARGVSVAAWIDAPPPPAVRAECEDDPERAARCPALRCKYHLGRWGIEQGFACWLDVAELPDDERTFDLIGRLLGVTPSAAPHVAKRDCTRALQVCAEQDPETLRLLGVRRR